MKKLLILCTTLLLSLSINAIELKEGVHYNVINNTATKAPQIEEFYSFYCPHCFAFEPLAKQLKEKASKNDIKFKKNHVDFMRAASAEFQAELAKAQIISEKLNKPEVVNDIFKSIHVNRKPVKNKDDIKKIFIKHGVTPTEYDSLSNNFSVINLVKKMKIRQDKLMNENILKGVPAIIVNNKYLITPQGFKIETYDELFIKINDAIDELIERD
jgi:thiol:disulfide interchange protein DsbA